MNVEISKAELALMFQALGDPTRLGIFQLLRCCAGDECGVEVHEEGMVRPAGSLSVGEVCCRVTGEDRITSTISHHLKELRLAGLIRMEKRGRWTYCSIHAEALVVIGQFVAGPERGGCRDLAVESSTACCS